MQPQVPVHANNNFFNVLAPTTTASPPPMNIGMNRAGSYMTPTAAPTQANLFSSGSLAPTLAPTRSAPGTTVSTPSTAKPASAGGFDDLWKMSLGAGGGSSAARTSTPPAQSKSIKDLEREKAQAGIWGQGQNKPPMGTGFGAFGASSSAAPPSSGNGIDDLLF